jgi:hypothetical protein
VIHRAVARLVADAERVEGVEGVGAELDAGTDLADFRRLLQHGDGEALAHQRQRRGEAADAAAGDEYGKFLAHGCSPLCVFPGSRPGRIYSGWPMVSSTSPTRSM